MMKNKSALALTLAGLLAALACNLGGATPQLATAALPIVAPTAPPTEHASPITPAVESQTPTPTLAPGQGQAFYVAPNGEDADPGTLDQPWRTIQHAADTLGAGETVYVRAGTYSEDVVLRRSGAPGSPVTFAAYPGEQVILDGGGTLNSAFETDFSEPDPKASDITISGFRIQNYKAFGIVAWSVNDRLTFTDLVVQHNGSEGIRLSNSDGSLIQNVLLQNNEGGFDCTPVLPGAESDPGCTHLHIADAQSIDNGTQGDTGTDAFAVERGADILVERSLATGGPGDGFDFKSDRTILSQVTAHDTRNNIKMWGKDSLLVNALAYDAKADASLVLVAGGSYTVLNVTIA
ncbi:MAG: right-handed parallel beta-helix repeat-containing protein, partial [Chloroflexi bacterium]|nr:right-handed parallel beta-helix repeat-containing protein [Chloroflexota bacterium]